MIHHSCAIPEGQKEEEDDIGEKTLDVIALAFDGTELES
jgi:hypothetical protein